MLPVKIKLLARLLELTIIPKRQWPAVRFGNDVARVLRQFPVSGPSFGISAESGHPTAPPNSSTTAEASVPPLLFPRMPWRFRAG